MRGQPFVKTGFPVPPLTQDPQSPRQVVKELRACRVSVDVPSLSSSPISLLSFLTYLDFCLFFAALRKYQ